MLFFVEKTLVQTYNNKNILFNNTIIIIHIIISSMWEKCKFKATLHAWVAVLGGYSDNHMEQQKLGGKNPVKFHSLISQNTTGKELEFTYLGITSNSEFFIGTESTKQIFKTCC